MLKLWTIHSNCTILLCVWHKTRPHRSCRKEITHFSPDVPENTRQLFGTLFERSRRCLLIEQSCKAMEDGPLLGHLQRHYGSRLSHQFCRFGLINANE